MSQPLNRELLDQLNRDMAAAGIPTYGTSEVTTLRKAGKIDEAYQKAKERLDKEPENVWAKRDMSWVLYTYLKANSSPEKFDLFIGYLKELDELKLPPDELMLFDQVAWQVGKIVFALSREQNPDIKRIKAVFEHGKHFHYSKPSEVYSFLFKAFHKAFKEGPDYIPFAEWWDFNNFREDDFKKEKLPNGKDVMSTAEQGIIAYAKHLLPEQTFQDATVFKKEKAVNFMPFLDKVIETHPDLQYAAYFKAKLLLAAGDQENMLSALLPFAKRKRNEFWVWDVMSEAFPHDEDRRIACYCKALTCRTSDDFLIKIRHKMATWFIQNKMFNEARTEIENIVRAREANEWKIPNEIANWMSQDWYKTAKPHNSNFGFYKNHLQAAEEILYTDIPQESVVIEFVNTDKKVANFIASEQKFGFFKYDRFVDSLKVGDVLNVRFDGNGSEGHFRLLTLEKADDSNFTAQFVRLVKGEIRIGEGKPFGFVQDAFVHPSLVKKYKLQDKQTVEGRAIKSFNPEKKSWGWKLFEVI